MGGDEDPNILGEDADSIHRFFQLSFGASKFLAPMFDFPRLVDVYARGISWPAFLEIIGHNEFPLARRVPVTSGVHVARGEAVAHTYEQQTQDKCA
jgi:hypothetical protein